MSTILSYITFILLLLMVCLALFMIIFWRKIIQLLTKKFGKIILTDSYQENLAELIPGIRHVEIQNILENSLRATSGKTIYRPLISSHINWPHLDSITLIPAQTSPFPIDNTTEVDMQVTIGPKAKKPLKIEIPILISGMGYGIGLSEPFRLALAKAAKKAKTAINSGEGGILPEELDAAGKYILQFSRTNWAKEEEVIKRADMIEIKLGQGAMLGMGKKIPPKDLSGRAAQIMGVKGDEDAVIFEHFFENQTLEDLKNLVQELRTSTGGVPIGAKIAAGGKLEQDLDHLIEMDVDFIALDGGQAGMKEAPPILCDDFGIPTLHAIVRAVNHLNKRDKKESISLIVSGGLLIPGHFLKALALGADAVYIGTSILMSVSHTQTFKAVPFEPPTQVAWYNGKFADKFNIEEGEKKGEKFLHSCVEEMKLALKAMGKRSLKELSRKDLVSYDKLIAKKIGIPFSFEPVKEHQQDI